MKNYNLIKMLIIISMFFVSIYFYDKLPNQIVSHWNINNIPNGYSSKNFVFVIPILACILSILMEIFPKIDPKRKNYENFFGIYQKINIGILAFLFYVHFIITYANLEHINIGKYIGIGVGILMIFLGNYFGKIRQNYFVGFKTPWTLANEDVRNKTHRFFGISMVILGIIEIINELFFEQNLYIVVIGSCIIAILTNIYSIKISKNQ